MFACEELLLNVATGPLLPTNAPGAPVEVMLLPNVRLPDPNGEFSTGAAARLPATSVQLVDPAGSARV